MKLESSHDAVNQLLPWYANATLSPAEGAVVEEHLAQCGSCAQEVQSLREIRSAMVELAEPAPPLKSALARTLSAIDEWEREKVRLQNSLPETTTPIQQRPAFSFSWWHEIQAWFRRTAGLGWATSAAAILLLILAMRDNTRLRQNADSLSSRIAELESAQSQQRMVLATLTSPDVRVVNLAGQGSTREAEGRIFWDQPGRKWYFYVHDLPPVQSNRTYQLWFVPTTGNPISAGVFNTNADGSATVEIPVPENAGTLQAAAVTPEPAGGLLQPTGPFALLGTME